MLQIYSMSVENRRRCRTTVFTAIKKSLWNSRDLVLQPEAWGPNPTTPEKQGLSVPCYCENWNNSALHRSCAAQTCYQYFGPCIFSTLHHDITLRIAPEPTPLWHVKIKFWFEGHDHFTWHSRSMTSLMKSCLTVIWSHNGANLLVVGNDCKYLTELFSRPIMVTVFSATTQHHHRHQSARRPKPHRCYSGGPRKIKL